MVDKLSLKDLEKECFDFIESDQFLKKREGKKDSEKAAEESKHEEKISRSKVAEYTESHMQKIKNFDEIGFLPKKGQQIRLVTQKSFNMYTIMLKILEKESVFEELYLSSFNIKGIVIDTVFEMVKSKQALKLRILLSQTVRARMPQRIIQLEKHMLQTMEDVKIKLNWNHTKITLVKTKKNFYVLEGSGNLSDNAQIEQYLFENNEKMYNFHKEWMENSFKKNCFKMEEIILPGNQKIK